MNHQMLPLYNGLVRHSQNNPISFHVPGHKSGLVFPETEEDSLFRELLKIDVTELHGLDDLHSADGIIKEAQVLTADLYKVRRSYFLVGGSTAGNLAMILTVCNSGDYVFVQRNSHKSVMNALRLANVNPIFLAPEYHYEGQISTNVSYETFEKAIKRYPNAKAIILTSPNYYGMVANDLERTVDLAHSYGIPILVDEAHGAHFVLGVPFPPSALQFGADIVVQSAHKTLPAMTMGSLLHYNSNRVDHEKLEYYLQVVQSSSPSYPIMASLDLSRYFLANLQTTEKEAMIRSILDFREALATIPQIRLLSIDDQDYKGDLLKLIVQTNCGLTGYELQRVFENEQIYTELADLWNVLFVLPLALLKNVDQITEKIKRSLQTYPAVVNKEKQAISDQFLRISTLDIPYSKMKKYKTSRLPLKRAEGFVAASSVIPYPPGIPFILPGERITSFHIDMLYNMKGSGATFQNGVELWRTGIEIFQ